MRENWIKVELGEVCQIISGKNQKQVENPDGKYPIYGSGGVFGYAEEYLCEPGTTIIGRKGTINSPIYVNQKFWNVDTAFGISPLPLINSKYIYFFCVGYNFKKLDKSTTIPSLAKRDILKIGINLAPLPEQRAIVAKIEQLFSELDKGIQNLKTAQEQLKVYRQAVLKKAFEGELTKEWRNKQTNLPSAEDLLQQIKDERQKHYQQQLENWQQAVTVWDNNGKEGKKPGKPKIVKEVAFFTKEELIKMSNLPENWKWFKLGNIFQIFVGSTPSRKEVEYWDGDINWVSSGEVAFSRIKETKEKITHEGLDNSSTNIHPIGTVMLAMIGEGKTRGQSAILDIEASHNQNTAAIRVSEINFSPEYLFYYLNFKYERNRKIGSGNNQKALNQSRIMEFDFPLCAVEEQHQIVQEIESRLSVCDKVEESIKESLQKAEALRQSILKKAFEGRLLSEAEVQACHKEKDYELASVLLEKIKGEKLAKEQEVKKNKSKKKKN